jgi:hypothetical protein
MEVLLVAVLEEVAPLVEEVGQDQTCYIDLALLIHAKESVTSDLTPKGLAI